MPIFNYTAKDIQGNYHKGEIETVDERQAAAILRRRRLIVISVKSKSSGGIPIWDKFINRVSFSDVVITTRQLATMVSAGLVLSEALDILTEQQTNKRFKAVLEAIGADVKGGLDFASALDKYPDVFPHLYSQLVRAGQASGKLDVILNELADNLEKEREFRSKVRGAMIYPIVVVTMMIGVMLIMVFFVMPRLMGLYQQSNIELPIMTRIMLGIAGFMIGYWWAILAVVILLVVMSRRYASTPEGRLTIDRVILKIPIIGRITKVVVMTNFTRTLGLLVTSGISILESIHIVGEIVGNKYYKLHLDEAYKGVERGLTLSSQLIGMPIFPRIVGQMIKTGEETGKLDDVMFKLSEYFESEADNSLKNITTLIEPIVLVLLGLGVAFLVISIILPIYQLTTAIK